MTKILIVEDEMLIRRGIRAILERAFGEELQFFEAEDGIDAIEVYNQELPLIIITDVIMPECDGLEMIERINAQTSSPPEYLVISGHSEFEYAKRALKLGVLDYLLKPIDKAELVRTVKMLLERNEAKQSDNKKQLRDNVRLKEATKRLREQELNKLLSRSGEEVFSQVKSRLMAWDITLEDAMYICVVASHAGQDDEELTQFSLENICVETLMPVSQRIQFFFDQEGRMVYLIPGEDQLQLRMLATKAAAGCQEHVQHYLSMQCFFGIGSPVYLAENIYVSYNQACAALRYKIVDADARIMEYEKLNPGQVGGRSTDWRKILEILMEEGAKSACRELMAGLEESHTTAFINELQQRQEEMQEYFSQHMPVEGACPEMASFESFWSLPEWRRAVQAYLEEFRNVCLVQNKTAPLKKSSVEILDYIREHATEDLTLTAIAGHFNYNASYISALLKREMGKNFSKYITELRIDKSKKLLRETNFTTKEVAAQVGFNNSSYFSQVFKKETGMTPQDFRNS